MLQSKQGDVEQCLFCNTERDASCTAGGSIKTRVVVDGDVTFKHVSSKIDEIDIVQGRNGKVLQNQSVNFGLWECNRSLGQSCRTSVLCKPS
jgi:hypothetical protein